MSLALCAPGAEIEALLAQIENAIEEVKSTPRFRLKLSNLHHSITADRLAKWVCEQLEPEAAAAARSHDALTAGGKAERAKAALAKVKGNPDLYKAKIALYPYSQASRGFGYVSVTEQQYDAALALSHTRVLGREIEVEAEGELPPGKEPAESSRSSSGSIP